MALPENQTPSLPLQVALFPGLYRPGCIVRATTWEDLAKALTTPIPTAAKEDGRLWSPTEWWEADTVGEDSAGKPILRASGRPAQPGYSAPRRIGPLVRSVTCAVVDFDDAPLEDMGRVRDTIKRLGLAAVLHSTWSHGAPGKPANTYRFRIVVPFDRPVPHAAWASTWPQVIELFGGKSKAVDRSCKDFSRGYFPHTHHPDRRPFAVEYQGRPLTLRDLPAVGSQSPQDGPVTITRPMLEALSRKLLRGTGALGEPMRALSAGEPFAAAAGTRHDTARALVQAIVKEWPGVDPEQGTGLFSASLSHPGMRVDLAEVEKLFHWAKGKQEAEQAIAVDAVASELAESCRVAFARTEPGREHPYLHHELEELARRHVAPIGHKPSSVSNLGRAWILVAPGKQCYVLGPGGYESFDQTQLASAARSRLAPAVSAGVQVFMETAAGKRKLRPFADLLAEYSSPVRHVRYRYQEPGKPSADNYDHRTSTLTIGVAPLAEVAPRHDPQIAEWLRLLAGDEAHHDALLRWLAQAPDTQAPLAALFVVGPRGAGKSLLCDGIASLWENRSADADTVAGSWNDGLTQTALIKAEERLPQNAGRGEGMSTEWFRSLASERTLTINRRYHDAAQLEGCPRFVANLQSVEKITLSGGDGAEDFAAIAERAVLIEVREEAAAFLATIPQDVLSTWTTGRRFAAHVYAIRKAFREAGTNPRQGRFGVVLDAGDHGRRLAARGNMQAQILEWMGAALFGPKRGAAQGVRVKREPNGEFSIWANASTIRSTWDEVFPHGRAPTTTAIGRALATLAPPDAGSLREENVRYRALARMHVEAWAEHSSVCDVGARLASVADGTWLRAVP